MFQIYIKQILAFTSLLRNTEGCCLLKSFMCNITSMWHLDTFPQGKWQCVEKGGKGFSFLILAHFLAGGEINKSTHWENSVLGTAWYTEANHSGNIWSTVILRLACWIERMKVIMTKLKLHLYLKREDSLAHIRSIYWRVEHVTVKQRPRIPASQIKHAGCMSQPHPE